MGYDQQAECAAPPKQQEPLLVLGVVRIVNQSGSIIGEHGLGVFKGHPVLPQVG